MGSDKFLLFLSSKLFNIVHHPFFIRVLFSATHIICNIWLSMCSLLKIWLDSVRMGIIIVTVPLVCKKRTLGSYFLFYHYGTTYRVCNMAVNIHILSYYMLNMSWQQNMTEMVVIKNISERWQQEMATEDPILQNTYIHTYIYTYILTYFRVRHTHTWYWHVQLKLKIFIIFALNLRVVILPLHTIFLTTLLIMLLCTTITTLLSALLLPE